MCSWGKRILDEVPETPLKAAATAISNEGAVP